MPLPSKSYHRLAELSALWCAPVDDLECYVLDGLLEVSVMAIGLPVEVGRLERDSEGGGWMRVDARPELLSGLQPVVAADLWPVFRHGLGRVARLKPPAPDGFVELADGVDPILVTMTDLLVARSERQRFEAAHGLGASEPEAAAASAEPGFLHRNGYAEVVSAGEVFRLGPLQAAIVRQLHEASATPDPWRTGKELLAASRSESQKIVDLFKSKPNWRSLIVSDGRGRYRLNLADRPVARSSHRAYRRLPSLFLKALPRRSHRHPTPIPTSPHG